MKLYEGCFWCRTWLRGYLLLALCTCAWLLSSHNAAAAAAGSQDAAARLLNCYNGVHSSSSAQGLEHAAPATFNDFLQGLPPRCVGVDLAAPRVSRRREGRRLLAWAQAIEHKPLTKAKP